MANKRQEVCKRLGVEVGEEFKIFNEGLSNAKYKFTLGDGLVHQITDNNWAKSVSLNALLTGKAKIHKLPYHPKFGDEYWAYVDKTWFPSKFAWLHSPIDYAFLGSGMVFRSYEEAIAGRPATYKRLTGEEWRG